MKAKRIILHKDIECEEAAKIVLQNEIDSLQIKMSQLNDRLAAKKSTKNKLDHIVRETESMYAKIIESSQALLYMTKQEAANLDIMQPDLEESSD
ncbi:hypothetical protein J437_LFUL010789 [Ladona fulva]|uniref:Sjoegren syndrome nuclear autoantigen 1 n=1 Tax=Ladona fulva TaxID=123851 RepID=A0A8K0P3A6_LADFU|nr:hypothetical protein J437_LFUL010789 [Ladona fulva]